MTLIRNIQTENEQRQWLERHSSKVVVEKMVDKPEEVMIKLDKAFVQLSNHVKRLAGRPVDDPEYMKAHAGIGRGSLNQSWR